MCTNAGYDYTRSGNPTRAALEETVSVLEGGAGATCTSTGMSPVVVALNLLPRGSHLLCTVDCYGVTFRALEHAKAMYGLEVNYLAFRHGALDAGPLLGTFAVLPWSLMRRGMTTGRFVTGGRSPLPHRVSQWRT